MYGVIGHVLLFCCVLSEIVANQVEGPIKLTQFTGNGGHCSRRLCLDCPGLRVESRANDLYHFAQVKS